MVLAGAGLWCLSCICLLAMHTLICVTFSLPPGVRCWLRLLLVALPGLFCLPFFLDCYNCTQFELYKDEIRIEHVKKMK